MTRKLQALALAAFVVTAAFTGGATHALLTDTEGVALGVSANVAGAGNTPTPGAATTPTAGAGNTPTAGNAPAGNQSSLLVLPGLVDFRAGERPTTSPVRA